MVHMKFHPFKESSEMPTCDPGKGSYIWVANAILKVQLHSEQLQKFLMTALTLKRRAGAGHGNIFV